MAQYCKYGPVTELCDAAAVLLATVYVAGGFGVVVQIHTGGIRRITAQHRVIDWTPPAARFVLQGTCNSRQCAIALSGGYVSYFEYDDAAVCG